MTPKLGVCYYPEHWPRDMWAKDAAEMVELGLSLVRIGEFAWSRLEPNYHDFRFEWLDAAITILGEAGLKVILGTPSATPPRWITETFPDMFAFGKNGNPRGFGSRRHYCFSHDGYREAAARMAGILATRYKDNPHIHSWQVDNEYGCHETIISYSPVAKTAFQKWLQTKYTSIEKLNTAWGNVFWSMEYSDFDQIGLPNFTVTEPNPSHVMDFRRFSSDQVALFNRAQCDAIREHCSKPLIHNYMGRITDFDHYTVGDDLDYASWDSYPLGFLEDRSDQTDHFKHEFQRQGDPDFQAFHHDIYRTVGGGKWGIMEQQPGPVNWAPYNPAPLPGMVPLWSWEAIAHGAEFVNYFRWRQVPFGQEQMHSALKRPDNTPTKAYGEIAKLAKELEQVNVDSSPSKIAVIFDYESHWAWDIQPQGQAFNYFKLIYDFYKSLRDLGQSVDIISPHHLKDMQDYTCLIIPGLFSLTPELSKTLKAFKGQILLGPRTGSKTADFHIDINGLAALGLDISVTSVETLRPTETIKIDGTGNFIIWREDIETTHEIIKKDQFGRPALIKSGNLQYLCGWPDKTALTNFIKPLLEQTGQTIEELPQGLRVRRFGHKRLYMNYNNHKISFGDITLPPAGTCLK